MPGARLELARLCGAVDFETSPGLKQHLSTRKNIEQNQHPSRIVLLLSFCCSSLFSTNIGTKPGQSGHYSFLFSMAIKAAAYRSFMAFRIYSARI
jgi:hypothetical protein